MPPITSPLSALRFSGRLMVIQNACPRFSRITLSSVMACSPVRCALKANICDGIACDCKRDLGQRSGLPGPDLVVMECGAADRRDRLRTGQHVDAAAADMVAVRVDR